MSGEANVFSQSIAQRVPRRCTTKRRNNSRIRRTKPEDVIRRHYSCRGHCVERKAFGSGMVWRDICFGGVRAWDRAWKRESHARCVRVGNPEVMQVFCIYESAISLISVILRASSQEKWQNIFRKDIFLHLNSSRGHTNDDGNKGGSQEQRRKSQSSNFNTGHNVSLTITKYLF